MNTEIADITTRLESVELNSSKKKLMITGIKLPNEKDKMVCIQALDKFLKESVGVNVHVDDYFMLGEGDVRPIILIFSCLEDKRLVLSCKSNLKNVRVNGNKVYISEYLPPTALEKRKRDQKIVSDLRDLGKEDALTYVRGNLAIHGVPYRKLISPPTPRELINMSAEEISHILSLETTRGDEFVQHKSSFIGYTADVTSHDQIAQLYKKLKLIKPEARHIVCAYVIKCNDADGTDCNKLVYTRDFHDDGEPGAGRVVLDLLERNQIANKVVFIARKYGGIRMGSDRFVCYLKSAMSCLEIEQEEDEEYIRKRNQRKQERAAANKIRGRGAGSYRSRSYGRRGGSNPGRTEPFSINYTKESHPPSFPPQKQQNFIQRGRPSSAIKPPVSYSDTQGLITTLIEQFPVLQQIQASTNTFQQQRGSRYHREMQSVRGYQHQTHLYGARRRGYPAYKVPFTSSAQPSPNPTRRNSEASCNDNEDNPSMEYSFSKPAEAGGLTEDRNYEQWSSDNRGAWSL